MCPALWAAKYVPCILFALRNRKTSGLGRRLSIRLHTTAAGSDKHFGSTEMLNSYFQCKTQMHMQYTAHTVHFSLAFDDRGRHSVTLQAL